MDKQIEMNPMEKIFKEMKENTRSAESLYQTERLEEMLKEVGTKKLAAKKSDNIKVIELMAEDICDLIAERVKMTPDEVVGIYFNNVHPKDLIMEIATKEGKLTEEYSNMIHNVGRCLIRGEDKLTSKTQYEYNGDCTVY